MKTALVSRVGSLAGSVALASAGDLTIRIPPDLVRRKLYFGLAFSGITSISGLVMEIELTWQEGRVIVLRDRLSGSDAATTVPYTQTTWDGSTAARDRWEGYGELPPYVVTERAFNNAVPPAVDTPPVGSLDDAMRFALFHNPSAVSGLMNRYDFVCWPRTLLARADKVAFRFRAGSITAEANTDHPATIAFLGCKSEGY